MIYVDDAAERTIHEFRHVAEHSVHLSHLYKTFIDIRRSKMVLLVITDKVRGEDFRPDNTFSGVFMTGPSWGILAAADAGVLAHELSHASGNGEQDAYLDQALFNYFAGRGSHLTVKLPRADWFVPATRRGVTFLVHNHERTVYRFDDPAVYVELVWT